MAIAASDAKDDPIASGYHHACGSQPSRAATSIKKPMIATVHSTTPTACPGRCRPPRTGAKWRERTGPVGRGRGL